MNIVTGKIKEPQKVVIYGTQGAGKSTLASLFPSPLFLDVEDGTRQLDVARVVTRKVEQFDEAVAELALTPAGTYKTIIVDTVDWLENKLRERITDTVPIKERSFGQGEVLLGAAVMARLAALTRLVQRGYHVVLLAHSVIIRVDLPDQEVAFDRYEVDLNRKQGAMLIKHWADHLLLLKLAITVRETEDKTTKPVSKGKRLLCFTQHAAYDAKTRGTISGEQEWDGTSAIIDRLLGEGPKEQAVVTATKPATKPAAKPRKAAVEPAPPAAPEPEPEREPEQPADAPVTVFVEPEQPAATGKLADAVRTMLRANAGRVNAFLRARDVITEEQDYESISAEYFVRITKSPDGFMKMVNAHAEGGQS